MDTKFLVALLPIIFMLHDFEEIIMFGPWLKKNRAEVRRRFPAIDRALAKSHDHLSTSAFAVAVLHEFLIIAVITYASLFSNTYHWWFGAFAAFSLHALVHIAQWIIFGKYAPFVITSILALPYCAFALIQFLQFTSMTPAQMALWAAIGIAITLASFPSAFFWAGRFEAWKNANYLRGATH